MLWMLAFNTSSSKCCCKQALLCLLQYSKDNSEAAEIGYMVDDALDAGFQYLKLKTLL
jgi:hypothetical protein